MKVVAYLRVSTDKQAEEGLGLDVQRQAITAWAKTEGHRVVLWAADEGVSGSNGVDTRAGLFEAIDALKDGTGAALVVYRLDRLARDLVLQEQLLADLRRIGADVFTTAASEQAYLKDDPDDPSRAMIRQVLGAVNQYERSMIRLRLRSGRRRKAEKGGYAYGAPPFGWEARDRELVPIPAEQATITRIRELRDEGLSLRQIAWVLDQEQRPARRGNWTPRTLAQIIRRDEGTAP